MEGLKNAGVDVDIFGNCADEWEKVESDKIDFNQYRFYLAFENAMCPDYATEKVSRALQLSQKYGVIPVVYGAADYNSIMPEGSFIDSLSFDSTEAFASHLLDLTNNGNNRDEEIASYFRWQNDYIVDDGQVALKMHLLHGMTSLCQRLWRPIDELGVYSSVENLRQSLGRCRL